MYRINEVMEMAIRGIPGKYRAEIWMIYSGEAEQRATQLGW